MNEVLADFRVVDKMAAELGIHINHSKSELIYEDTVIRETILHEAPILKMVSSNIANLLGFPIGKWKGIVEGIQAKVEQLQLLGDRLRILHSHDALIFSDTPSPSPNSCTPSTLDLASCQPTLKHMMACSNPS